jgi:hypothetical protein
MLGTHPEFLEQDEEKDWRKKIRHIIIVRSKLFKTFSLRTATSLIVLLEQRESSQHVKKLS